MPAAPSADTSEPTAADWKIGQTRWPDESGGGVELGSRAGESPGGVERSQGACRRSAKSSGYTACIEWSSPSSFIALDFEPPTFSLRKSIA